MAIDYAEDKLIQITQERDEEIKRYIINQDKLEILKEKNLCKYFEINYQKEELDIDKLTEDQRNKLDKASESEREALLKKYPKTMQSYSMWAILPFEIQNTLANRVISIDHIETDTLKLINDRTESRINLYSEYITK